MSRHRRWRFAYPLCPSCGRQWRWMHWYGTKYRYYKHGTHPHGEPQCNDAWHDTIVSRHYSSAPMPIPDGRKVLGSPDERRARRIRRHRQHQGKARR